MKTMQAVDLDAVAAKVARELGRYRAMLMVCTGTGCVSAQGFKIRDGLAVALKARGLEREILVVGTGCNGFCAVGPIVVVQPEGVFYQKVGPADLAAIVDEHLVGGKIVRRLLHQDPATGEVHEKMKDIRFFNKQQLVALRNKGLIDPENIEHYIARGGYRSLKKLLAQPDAEA
ncbi:MAG: NADH-quinone oxidoreductase subunit F, partial [Elusimicrobia bacterium]|nr:NADH-quinone oxidoreductase subunit F [Elusimicrobiota bacterium]